MSEATERGQYKVPEGPVLREDLKEELRDRVTKGQATSRLLQDKAAPKAGYLRPWSVNRLLDTQSYLLRVRLLSQNMSSQVTKGGSSHPRTGRPLLSGHGTPHLWAGAGLHGKSFSHLYCAPPTLVQPCPMDCVHAPHLLGAGLGT